MRPTEFEETRAFARLPNLDVEVRHRHQPNEEQIFIAFRAAPSFAAFNRLLATANPLSFWMAMVQTAWLPWLNGISAASASRRIHTDE
ncbi:MAG: hypothetical protein JOY71_30235 [Acetobacteraceae bacterium]|nr:hypothetical protein [Acetobacteraceae bacterium]MBV8589489.1 hypothetical protein [Acetobacteraceae bacterium]